MSDFTDFATGVGKGLAKAYTEDIDVFLLFTAGILSGTPSKPLRGLGKALTLYTTFRRADQYMTVLTQHARYAIDKWAEQNDKIWTPGEPFGG